MSETIADPRVQAADRAVGAGDLNTARRLLEEAADSAGNDPALWLRLAAVCRAAKNPGAALEATHQALKIAPLDFTALLLRADLLDRLARPEAAEAWRNALAQKPEEALPDHLKQVVERAETRIEQWTSEREQRMRAAMQPSESRADAGEQRRLERFRNNVLRRTRPYHSSPTHFHFPELREHEFYPREPFRWLPELEAATETIALEMDALLSSERAELVPYVQYADYLPLDQWRLLNNNRDWAAIHLLQNGRPIEANARHCPHTLALLEKCDQPQVPGASPNAMFSLLAPGTAIPPHVGVNNTRLVCHLPLLVPEGCWFRVGAETRSWKRGQAFVFDDTIEHEAMNPSDQLRVVFIFDVWQPQLSALEREAVAALVASEGGDPSAGL